MHIWCFVTRTVNLGIIQNKNMLLSHKRRINTFIQQRSLFTFNTNDGWCLKLNFRNIIFLRHGWATDRVVGSEQLASWLWQVDQGLQTWVAFLQHHCGPQSALMALQPGGQALDALLQLGHCGEPTLLFEAGCGALKAKHRDRWGERRREVKQCRIGCALPAVKVSRERSRRVTHCTRKRAHTHTTPLPPSSSAISLVN